MSLTKEQMAALIIKYHPAYKKGGSLLDLCFPKQREAFESKELLTAIQCTRRAGKSYGCGLDMVQTAIKHPRCLIPYITLTAESGKNIIAPVMREIKKLYQAPIEERKDGKEWLVHPNTEKESKIFVAGADQKNFLDRLRGPKYPKVFIDEAASFRRTLLETMVDEIFIPAVGDYNGQIYLIGTPGPVPDGYFYDASQGKNGFKSFFWKVIDNPYFPNPQGFMEALLERKNWTRDTPKFRREWLGEWVLDSDSLVYKYNEERNGIDELPRQHTDWRYIIGMDVGFHDKTAFAIVCYTPGSPNAYIYQTLSFNQMIPHDAAIELRRLVDYYDPDSVVMDTGGLGRSIAEEFRKRYSLPIKAAEKTDKMGHIEMMNDDFQTGRLKVVRENNQGLLHQYKTLQKLDNGKEDPTVFNDLCDSALYSWRESKHFTFQDNQTKLDKNSNEYMEAEWKKISQKMQKNQEPDFDQMIDDFIR